VSRPRNARVATSPNLSATGTTGLRSPSSLDRDTAADRALQTSRVSPVTRVRVARRPPIDRDEEPKVMGIVPESIQRDLTDLAPP